jgi:hypothetical protein
VQLPQRSTTVLERAQTLPTADSAAPYTTP